MPPDVRSMRQVPAAEEIERGFPLNGKVQSNAKLMHGYEYNRISDQVFPDYI